MNKLKNSIITGLMVASVITVGGCNKNNNYLNTNENATNNNSVIVNIGNPIIDVYSVRSHGQDAERMGQYFDRFHKNIGDKEITTYIKTDKFNRESLIKFAESNYPELFQYNNKEESLYVDIDAVNDNTIYLTSQLYNHKTDTVVREQIDFSKTNFAVNSNKNFYDDTSVAVNIGNPIIDFYSEFSYGQDAEKMTETFAEFHKNIGDEEIITYVNTEKFDRESLIKFAKTNCPELFEYNKEEESLHFIISASNEETIYLNAQRYNHVNDLIEIESILFSKNIKTKSLKH